MAANCCAAQKQRHRRPDAKRHDICLSSLFAYTDEFEEQVILYRIGHRMKIAEALKRKSAGSKEAL